MLGPSTVELVSVSLWKEESINAPLEFSEGSSARVEVTEFPEDTCGPPPTIKELSEFAEDAEEDPEDCELNEALDVLG